MSRSREGDERVAGRFRKDLDRLISPGQRLGIAVSGGPDSLGLLLLANAARPAEIEAATVDHALRPESTAEAEIVASACQSIGVPHTVLKLHWHEQPATGLQEKARAARYDALGQWAAERSISALLTAHHRDDQAETLLMRLSRGAGVRGLAAMRPSATLPGHPAIKLLRPLLTWSGAELLTLCNAAGLDPVKDPTNQDQAFERVRVRAALAESKWLDPQALARSAANLAGADEALDWAAQQEWNSAVARGPAGADYTPAAPGEIRRRIVARLVAELATEGSMDLRGRELDRILAALAAGSSATLRGVLCTGGKCWSFRPAPQRGRPE